MIARFHSRVTRRVVMVAARGTLANNGLRVINDLTQKDLETKRRVLPLMEKLYTENKKPRFTNGRLFSNGKPVPQATIDAFLAQTYFSHYISIVCGNSTLLNAYFVPLLFLVLRFTPL